MATVIVGVFGIQWIRRGGPVPNDGNGGPPPPELILVERWQPSVWVEVDGVGVKLIPEGPVCANAVKVRRDPRYYVIEMSRAPAEEWEWDRNRWKLHRSVTFTSYEKLYERTGRFDAGGSWEEGRLVR